jgi:hypothetical protein
MRNSPVGGDFFLFTKATTIHNHDWLVVEPTPLKNMSLSVGMMTFPIYGKIKNVPNHQPVEI